MSDRAVAVVRTKAKVLREHITRMKEMLSEDVIDKPNLALRLTDLSTSFHKYEELYENLFIADKGKTDATEWAEIRELYYEIASKICKLKSTETTVADQTLPPGEPAANSTFIEKQKLLRLPVAELPKFDGDYDHWLSYKNAFVSMVDARSDIDDTVKFLYLRNSLTGDALRKIAVYDIRSENYVRAWQTLVSSYERKRILVSKHVDAILGILPVKNATAKELSKLIDDVKQHLSMLESLKVKVDCRIVIRLIERALPLSVREKWEESHGLDELPTLETLYTFINEITFRLYTLETDAARDDAASSTSRAPDEPRPAKIKKRNDGVRALITNVDSPCPQCKGQHALYRCESFKGLPVPDRWGVARTNKLCFNCLRQHKGKCGMGHCKACEKNHNTLLHPEANAALLRSSGTLANSVAPQSKGSQPA